MPFNGVQGQRPWPSFATRGTIRNPGADPRRLAIGLDLRAISVIEGVRAGLAAAPPMFAVAYFNQPLYGLAALGALLTCICDPGGVLRRRLPVLLAFLVMGAACLGGFGLLRATGFWPTLAVAGVALFGLGYMRVWGQSAQVLGMLTSVVVLLGTDTPAAPTQAAVAAGLFAAGSAFALFLSLVIWRIDRWAPLRQGVGGVWADLADKARVLQRLLAEPATLDVWEHHARASRGTIRSAIERARGLALDSVASRGRANSQAARYLLRLETADQVFGGLIALWDLLETADPPMREVGAQMLRRLRPVLSVLAAAAEDRAVTRLGRLETAIATLLTASRSTPQLHRVAARVAERLRVAITLADPQQLLPGGEVGGSPGLSLRQRLVGPARANLNWGSAPLRHALRVAVVVTGALATTMVGQRQYGHWLTITLLLVMQPYFALTWQRFVERMGGTLLGGAMAAGLSAALPGPAAIAAVLPVLGGVALAVRQVSYAVYIAIYTPVVILLVETLHPGTDNWSLAILRAGYTLGGGAVAVLANVVLWPTSDAHQVRTDLLAAVSSHAGYAEAVLLRGQGADRARGVAGVRTNNLEASLARALQSPHRGRGASLEAALVADAALRRLAARLTVLSHGEVDASCLVRRWVVDALRALGCGGEAAARPEGGEEGVERLGRQIEMLAEVLPRVK